MQAVVDRPGCQPATTRVAAGGGEAARPLVGGVLVDPAGFLSEPAPVADAGVRAAPARRRHLSLVPADVQPGAVPAGRRPASRPPSPSHPSMQSVPARSSAVARPPVAVRPAAPRAVDRPVRPAPSAAAVARRRLAVAAGVLVLSVVGIGMATASPGRVAPAAPALSRSYVVQPGDSLWSLARRAQPTGDVRPLVRLLTLANGGPNLEVGATIAVP